MTTLLLFRPFPGRILHCTLAWALWSALPFAARAVSPPDTPVNLTLTNGRNNLLSWNASTGLTYRVQTRTNLGTNTVWKTEDAPVAGSNLMLWLDPLARGTNPQGYYRVLNPQPEIRRVEPAFVTTNAGSNLYLVGQCFTSNDLFRINGVLLTNPVVFGNTNACVSLPSLPPGTYDVEMLNAQTQVVARLNFALTVDGAPNTPHLDTPKPPPAAPVPRRFVDPLPEVHSFFDVFVEVELPPAAPRTPQIPQPPRPPPRFVDPMPEVHSFFDVFAEVTIEPQSPRKPAAFAGPRSFFDVFVEIPLGETHQRSVDLLVPGRGLNFAWARHYRSRLGPSTAQGNNWDFSYNLSAQPAGSNVVVADGNARHDTFYLRNNGAYAADGIPAEGQFQSNGMFVVTWANAGKWEFKPTGGPAGGMINRIMDRNTNQLSFVYDGLGRLVQVVDTLNRTNQIAYNADGFIQSVTDFSGRQVSYLYHDGTDTNGNFGDLKAVITPAVTNTPTGNDFPGGKTNLYTYSTGAGDARLNGNLLTITDAKGQVWLRNSYATNSDPANPLFDRVVSQQRGNSNDLVMFAYLPQTAAPSNQFATLRSIVNDRVGNVREYYSDSRGRLVRRQAFTGRAVPGVTTTDVANRPSGPLRSADPPYFETRCEWNADNLLTRCVQPNGNAIECVHELECDPDASRLARGNLRVYRCEPGPLGGDQSELATFFQHDPRFGTMYVPTEMIALSLTSQPRIQTEILALGLDSYPTLVVDSRGNVTVDSYDARGNRTNTVHRVPGVVDDWEYNSAGQLTAHTLPDNGGNFRRRDEFHYYSGGSSNGYLQSVIVDVASNACTTRYEYDLLGNLVRVITPLGKDFLLTVNSLSETVRILSPEITDGSGIRYRTDYVYDPNGNLVRRDREERDELGVVTSNSPLSVTFGFDLLNLPLMVTQKISAVSNTVTEYQYDPNRNLSLVRFGQATSGADTNNVIQVRYDERNLRFLVIRGPGGTNQSTSQFDYDPNASLLRLIQGFEFNPETNSYAYDGYGRLVRNTNAMGSVASYSYDQNGNLVRSRVDGETDDVPGGAGNVRLGERFFAYDAMDRPIFRIDSFFDVLTQLNLDDGANTTLFNWTANSQLKSVTDDRGATTALNYDSAGRPLIIVDPKNNSITYAYDADGNLIRATRVDKSDLLSPDQLFTNKFRYDNLDRLTNRVDNATNSTLYAYDSLSRRLLATDPLNHATRYEYDGLNRLVRTTRDMNGNGPNPSEAADIVTSWGYDANGRLISSTDDNGNTTRYFYDSLNRLVRQGLPDLTTNRFNYDPHDNLVVRVDANSSSVSNSYDALNRVTNRSIARGAGVVGPATEGYRYDSLSRIVRATNQDAIVVRVYDSLGRPTNETTQLLPAGAVRTSSAQFDAVGNRTNFTYPGGRLERLQFDVLNRVTNVTMQDGIFGQVTTPAMVSYVGRRIERVDYGNGTRLFLGYDAAGRPNAQLLQYVPTVTALDARSSLWDGANNRLAEQDPLASHSYTYDANNRLAASFMPPSFNIGYGLDGAGNRTNVTGSLDAGIYFMTGTLPTPADAEVNQYSQTPFDSRQYDNNGNPFFVFSSTQKHLSFDYRNQVMYFTNSNGSISVSNRYDAFGRRLEKNANGVITRYLYDHAGNPIEEQNGSDNTTATYVFAGPAVDNDDAEVVFVSLVGMQRNATNYNFHLDDLGSVVKVTGPSGNVLEQYAYYDYGQTFFFNAATNALTGSVLGNPMLFHGLRLDSDSGLYVTPGAGFTQLFEPRSGRTVSRGPDSQSQTVNPTGSLQASTAYAGNNPVSANPHAPAPLPAGFFDSGSEPFDGTVRLGGSDVGADTIVQRSGEPVTPAPAAAPKSTFVLPHLLEQSGRLNSTSYTFDTTIFSTYVSGLGNTVDGGGATVDLYFFDHATGQPMNGSGGVVNGPNSFNVDASHRKTKITVDDVLQHHGFVSPVLLGFGVIVVGGTDADGVNPLGFVVNSHTGAADLSVFGFTPPELKAAPPSGP
ncbi:MAG: RHS repeat protein [Verrucomicrobia bacterium]|nr:RHS repeat protein [Verrucomicrobiota bacterium]